MSGFEPSSSKIAHASLSSIKMARASSSSGHPVSWKETEKHAKGAHLDGSIMTTVQFNPSIPHSASDYLGVAL